MRTRGQRIAASRRGSEWHRASPPTHQPEAPRPRRPLPATVVLRPGAPSPRPPAERSTCAMMDVTQSRELLPIARMDHVWAGVVASSQPIHNARASRGKESAASALRRSASGRASRAVAHSAATKQRSVDDQLGIEAPSVQRICDVRTHTEAVREQSRSKRSANRQSRRHAGAPPMAGSPQRLRQSP